MKLLELVAIPLARAGCVAAPSILPGQSYTPPLGGITCRNSEPYPAQVQAAFGPHGGTARLVTELRMTRIDIVEFSPQLPVNFLSGPRIQAFHARYVTDSLMPLIRSGVPDARLLGQEDVEIDHRPVHLSSVLLPGQSGYVSGNAQRRDGIRAQAQYTDGRFMYVVSQVDEARPERSPEAQLKDSHRLAEQLFRACSLVEPPGASQQ